MLNLAALERLPDLYVPGSRRNIPWEEAIFSAR
jgi:hypothetical protein